MPFTHEKVDELENKLANVCDTLYDIGAEMHGSEEAAEIWKIVNGAWERANEALHRLYILRP